MLVCRTIRLVERTSREHLKNGSLCVLLLILLYKHADLCVFNFVSIYHKFLWSVKNKSVGKCEWLLLNDCWMLWTLFLPFHKCSLRFPFLGFFFLLFVFVLYGGGGGGGIKIHGVISSYLSVWMSNIILWTVMWFMGFNLKLRMYWQDSFCMTKNRHPMN